MREGQFRDTYSRPEMSREGEALYSRMNTGRSDTPNSVNSRRSGSDVRTSSTVSNRSVSRPETVQRSNDSRRSAPAVTNRSASRPETVQRSGDSRRSAPAVTNRSVSRPETVQRSVTHADHLHQLQPDRLQDLNQYRDRPTRRGAAPSVSTRTASRPESVQRPIYSQRSALQLLQPDGFKT